MRRRVRISGPSTILHKAQAFLAALLLASCAGDSVEDRATPSTGEPGAAARDEAAPGTAEGTTYRRTVVFVGASQDSSMYVPWEFANRVEPDRIVRSTRGWLGRSGEWRLFVEDDWSTETTRTPWRILPRGSARLIVGMDDALREIYFQEGVRDLSVRMGEVIAEWSGQRGETYRLLNGSTRLAGVETSGLVLDALTARPNEADEATELALVTAGRRFQLLFADSEGTNPYRAWALVDSATYSWPEVDVAWPELYTFERARRDVPVVWTISSNDPELEGRFEAVSSHQHAMRGTGARLPALGVYEIVGSVTVADERIEVTGFLRHLQR